jgi:hypothetical protein
MADEIKEPSDEAIFRAYIKSCALTTCPSEYDMFGIVNCLGEEFAAVTRAEAAAAQAEIDAEWHVSDDEAFKFAQECHKYFGILGHNGACEEVRCTHKLQGLLEEFLQARAKRGVE